MDTQPDALLDEEDVQEEGGPVQDEGGPVQDEGGPVQEEGVVVQDGERPEGGWVLLWLKVTHSLLGGFHCKWKFINW